MILKVDFNNVKKSKSVFLAKDLPDNKDFGNTFVIPEGTKGYVLSNGFEAGMLRVEFYTHYAGKQIVQFNELSANAFLVTDMF